MSEKAAGFGFYLGFPAVIVSGAVAPHHAVWLILTLPAGIVGVTLWVIWAAQK